MKRNNVDDISLQALLETLIDLAVSFWEMHILQTIKCLRNNVAIMLQHWVALKIVPVNRLQVV